MDTNFTAIAASISTFRSAYSQNKKQKEKIEREVEWKEKVKGSGLHRLAPVPSETILRIHSGIHKGYSALITQVRTGKISLKHFLHDRKVPGFEDERCECRRDRQTVRHVCKSED